MDNSPSLAVFNNNGMQTTQNLPTYYNGYNPLVITIYLLAKILFIIFFWLKPSRIKILFVDNIENTAKITYFYNRYAFVEREILPRGDLTEIIIGTSKPILLIEEFWIIAAREEIPRMVFGVWFPP